MLDYNSNNRQNYKYKNKPMKKNKNNSYLLQF